MRGQHKEGEVKQPSEGGSAKSLRFERGAFRACSNPFCKVPFTPRRKDQRFCCPECKETFFKVKYALQILAPYFNVDLEQGEEKT